MKRKVLGKTSLRVSEVALGGRGLCDFVWKESVAMIYQAMEEGINFIDTSADIRTSEDRIGDAFLVSRPGMNVFFSTRASADNVQDMAASISTSLGQLKRKAIDLYSIADVTAENLEQITGPRGPLAALTRAKNGKKVKYVGFQTDDVDVGMELLDNMVFDVAVIPGGPAALPFLEGKFMKKVRKNGTGILAVEPEDIEGYDRWEALGILRKHGSVVPVVDVRSTTELEDLVRIFGNKPRIFEAQYGETRILAEGSTDMGGNEAAADDDTDDQAATEADSLHEEAAETAHLPRLANRWAQRALPLWLRNDDKFQPLNPDKVTGPRLVNRWQDRKPAWLQQPEAGEDKADEAQWPVTNATGRAWLQQDTPERDDSPDEPSPAPRLNGHAGRPWLKG